MLLEALLGRSWSGEPALEGDLDVGSEFRSGGIVERDTIDQHCQQCPYEGVWNIR